MEKKFLIGHRFVTLLGAENVGAPVVWLNTVMGEGSRVLDECRAICKAPFVLAAVSGLDWDGDMTPWAIPPISEDDTPCSGKADEYLDLLVNRLIPAARETLGGKEEYSAIAGYSLAGLFALYALFRTDAFSKAACASGSFWFPNFTDYAFSHRFISVPECIYFSLGDREALVRNPILRPVEDNTRALEAHFREMGIRTVFVSNRGNHFQNGALRMAKGVKWILEN